jgi:hypothetical protein
LFTLDIKDWLKEDERFFSMGSFVSPLEQLSAPRTLYTGFRKAKLKKS